MTHIPSALLVYALKQEGKPMKTYLGKKLKRLVKEQQEDEMDIPWRFTRWALLFALLYFAAHVAWYFVRG